MNECTATATHVQQHTTATHSTATHVCNTHECNAHYCNYNTQDCNTHHCNAHDWTARSHYRNTPLQHTPLQHTPLHHTPLQYTHHCTTQSQVFRIFFEMFLGIIFFGGIHGLVLFPVLLSLFGPTMTRPTPPPLPYTDAHPLPCTETTTPTPPALASSTIQSIRQNALQESEGVGGGGRGGGGSAQEEGGVWGGAKKEEGKKKDPHGHPTATIVGRGLGERGVLERRGGRGEGGGLSPAVICIRNSPRDAAA